MKAIAIMVIVLGAIFVSGCMSNTPTTPVNESAAKATAQQQQPTKLPVRYVELRLTDGSITGGEYVSESANFVTIIPLYAFKADSDTLINGSGVEIGIKIALVNTMTNITDPRPFIAAKLQEQEEAAAAAAKARENATKASQAEQEKLRQEMMARGEITR